MSTRGSFIIRKNSESKELYVPMDAYPAGAGRDAVRLIKSLNLSILFDLLKTEEDMFEESDDLSCDEPKDFCLEQLVEAYRNDKKYVYQQTGEWFIQDSLVCEYG